VAGGCAQGQTCALIWNRLLLCSLTFGDTETRCPELS
jgi:hypothetical protein